MEILKAIEYLDSIPAEKWCIDRIELDDQRCAAGWLMVNKESPDIYRLEKTLKDFITVTPGELNNSIHGWNPFWNICNVNNGVTKEYTQENPKERILAYFRDALAAQEAVKQAQQLVNVPRGTSIPEMGTFPKMGKKIIEPVLA